MSSYKDFIHLSRNSIRHEINCAKNRLYELQWTRKYFYSPHRDAQEKELQERISALFKALQQHNNNEK